MRGLILILKSILINKIENDQQIIIINLPQNMQQLQEAEGPKLADSQRRYHTFWTTWESNIILNPKSLVVGLLQIRLNPPWAYVPAEPPSSTECERRLSRSFANFATLHRRRRRQVGVRHCRQSQQPGLEKIQLTARFNSKARANP